MDNYGVAFSRPPPADQSRTPHYDFRTRIGAVSRRSQSREGRPKSPQVDLAFGSFLNDIFCFGPGPAMASPLHSCRGQNMKHTFEVRDKRTGFAWINNEIIDEFLSEIGPSAFAVYVILA